MKVILNNHDYMKKNKEMFSIKIINGCRHSNSKNYFSKFEEKLDYFRQHEYLFWAPIMKTARERPDNHEMIKLLINFAMRQGIHSVNVLKMLTDLQLGFENETPLWIYIRRNDVEMVKYLLNKGATTWGFPASSGKNEMTTQNARRVPKGAKTPNDPNFPVSWLENQILNFKLKIGLETQKSTPASSKSSLKIPKFVFQFSPILFFNC